MITNYHLLAIDAKTGEIFRFPLDSDYEWFIGSKNYIDGLIEVKLLKNKIKKKNIFCMLGTHNYENVGVQKARGLYNSFDPITRKVQECTICGKYMYMYNKDVKSFKGLDLEWIYIKT
jgi:hypothetical protein